MRRGEGWRTLILLVLAGAALGAGIWHGLPHVYVPDTHIIRNALGMAKSGDLWPAAGTYSTYPYLLSYLLLPVYGATYLVGRALGCYESAEAFGRSMVEDPTVVYLEARILVALFGLVAVCYLYRTARRLNLTPAAAFGAALLLAFNPLFVQFGHQARPWIPLVAGVAFTFYHSAGIALEGRRRDYLLAAVGAGLTFAMHQVGGAVLLIPLAAHAAREGRGIFTGGGIRGFALVVIAFALTAFCLGYAHEVLGGAGQEVVKTDQSALDIGGQKFLLNTFSGKRAFRIAAALFGYDPVGCTLGWLGLAAGVLSAGFRGLRLALSVFCGLFLVVFLLYEGSHIRYLLPLAPGLALGAAYGATRLSDRLGLKAAWLLVPLVLFSAVQTARMDLLLCRTDTRDLARTWIEGNIPGGTRIAAEGYTAPLEPDGPSLTFLKEHEGVWLKRREEMTLEGKRIERPGPTYYLIPLERFYRYQSYWPHQYIHGDERPIADFLNSMEAAWLMLYDRWPCEARHPPLMEYIAERTEPGPVFSPSGGSEPSEATLPTDMDFPLTALWRLERPGPVIRLFKVKP